LYQLATAYVANGSYPEAIDALGALKRTGNRDYLQERTLLEGQAHEGMGNIGRAAEIYASIANAYPGEEIRVRLARLREQQGQNEAALKLYRETVFRAGRSDGAYGRRERAWISEAKRRIRELGGQ
jgi:hypothetical protein